MTEETLLSVEGAHDRTTIANYFRQFAEGLDDEGEVTFSTDETETTVSIPETAEFEVEIEQETEDEETEFEIEFQLEWSTEESAEEEEATLQIETGGGSDERTPVEADDEQETIDEAVEDAGGGRDAEMEEPNPPHGRSEVDAAEDDEGSQLTDTDEDR